MGEKRFRPGKNVVYHTFTWFTEQGQPDPSQWPKDKVGEIIKIDWLGNKSLVEFENGEREWCTHSHLDLNNPKKGGKL